MVDSLHQFPTKIQYIVNNWISNSVTPNKEKVRFSKGLIIDVDARLGKDSSTQAVNKRTIPTYQLYVEICDTSLAIKSYSLIIDLDEHGQILSFPWPETDGKLSNFLAPALILQSAKRYARKKFYKTQEVIFALNYHPEFDKMCWEISFLQKSEVTEKSFYKEYVTLVVEATSAGVLGERKMSNSGIGCNPMPNTDEGQPK